MTHTSPQRGFSVIEMMVAMSIIVMVFGATMILVFGNQTSVVDSQTNAEALNITQGLLEEEQALARKDFNLVNPRSVVSSDGFYTSEVGVTLSNDFLVKTVVATTSWMAEHGRERSVTLTTLVTNFDNAVGANTCDSTTVGENWASPTLLNSGNTDFSGLGGGVAGPITDLDVYQGRLYVTVNNASAGGDTLFVFDVSTPAKKANPTLLGKLDTDPGNPSGLNAVTVAESSLGRYAYVANASSPTTGQLQVVDVKSFPLSVTSSYAISGLTSGAGNSIYYKDGQAYLGLKSTAGAEKELAIIDVRNHNAPALRTTFGNDNHDVNALVVGDNYLYVASPDTERLKVYDIADPADPQIVSSYSGGGANGKAVYVVGDTVYLGTTVSGARYNVLDAGNPTSLVDTGISRSFSASVDGVIVRDTLAFVLTKDTLEILEALTPANTVGSYALPATSGVFEPVFDCEGKYLYIGSNNGNIGKLQILTAAP